MKKTEENEKKEKIVYEKTFFNDKDRKFFWIIIIVMCVIFMLPLLKVLIFKLFHFGHYGMIHGFKGHILHLSCGGFK